MKTELSGFNVKMHAAIASLSPTDAIEITSRCLAVDLPNGITAVFQSNGEFVTNVRLTSDKYAHMAINIAYTNASDICERITDALASWHQMMKASK